MSNLKLTAEEDKKLSDLSRELRNAQRIVNWVRVNGLDSLPLEDVTYRELLISQLQLTIDRLKTLPSKESK